MCPNAQSVKYLCCPAVLCCTRRGLAGQGIHVQAPQVCAGLSIQVLFLLRTSLSNVICWWPEQISSTDNRLMTLISGARYALDMVQLIGRRFVQRRGEGPRAALPNQITNPRRPFISVYLFLRHCPSNLSAGSPSQGAKAVDKDRLEGVSCTIPCVAMTIDGMAKSSLCASQRKLKL